MLIHKKILVRLLLPCLFLSFQFNAKATNREMKGSQFKPDFVSPDLSDWPQSQINDQDKKNGNIDFQVNSEITYLNIAHFKKAESKQAFLDALLKEKETQSLSEKTDGLRKAYASSPDDQKEKIAALILENERKITALNDEIPVLYEKARATESAYWQTVNNDEKAKFLGKINSYRDSIQQVEVGLAKQTQASKTVPDTIIYYRADKLNEVAAEPAPAVIYKIQVASFKTKLPESIAKAIKKLEILRKVDSYKDEKGVTIYTTGNLKTYQEALTLQTQVKAEGMKNATILAYKNGKRITLEEAQKLSVETNLKP